MILITQIEIQGFRSIQNAVVEPLSHFTAIAGVNNSGKSNVLRALNAFFNDETDAGQPTNVDYDFYRPDLLKKKRKRIRIGVSFELPAHFRFRAGLQGVEQLLGGQTFTITKEWDRASALPTFFLNEAQLGLADSQKIAQFLQLIKFRYVPNRVLPTELIRNEHQNLRDVLVHRLARRAKEDAAAFQAIRETSARMIESLTERFEEACPGQGAVSLATPTSFRDLAFAFGYKLARDGVEIDDVAQGSGIQSLLMLETLYLIDRDYFQQFGWRQAAVWGIEEPESSLHASLEARVAAYLSDVATVNRGRLQVFCTTHSDLIVQYSGRTILVENGDKGSVCESLAEPREALERLSRSGVSRWVHPILFWPLDPIILVEGQFDREFITEAFKHIAPSRTVRVVDLPALDPATGGGGVERMRQYIKENAGAIKARRQTAPVVVLLDWDAGSKRDAFAALVDAPGIYKVLAWPTPALNPKAGRTLKGIERTHCDRVLEEAIRLGAPIACTRAKPGRPSVYVVDPAEYEGVKQIIARIVRGGLQPDDLTHARPLVEQLLLEATAR